MEVLGYRENRSDSATKTDTAEEEEDILLNFSCVVYEVVEPAINADGDPSSTSSPHSDSSSSALEWSPVFDAAWCSIELCLRTGGAGTLSIAPVPIPGDARPTPAAISLDITPGCRWKRVKSRFVALRRDTAKGSFGFFFVNDKRARQFLTLVLAASMQHGGSSNGRRPLSLASTASNPTPSTGLYAPARAPTVAISPHSQGSRFSFPLDLGLDTGGGEEGNGFSPRNSETPYSPIASSPATDGKGFALTELSARCPAELAELGAVVLAALQTPSAPAGLFREPPAAYAWQPKKRSLTEYFQCQHKALSGTTELSVHPHDAEAWKDARPSDSREAAEAIKLWFRVMEPPLLADVSPSSDILSALQCLQQPYRSIFLWLMQFLGKVDSYACTTGSGNPSGSASKSRMTKEALAIVLSPNLFPYDTAPNRNTSPMEQMSLAMGAMKAQQQWLLRAIEFVSRFLPAVDGEALQTKK